jgi:hypothetical protein
LSCTSFRGRAEGGLERVLRVVDVAEHAPAHAQDRRSVPPDQGLEGGLVIAVQEGTEQLAVGLLIAFPLGGQVPDVPDD